MPPGLEPAPPPSPDEWTERVVVSQMKKYSKPVVKTVEKGTIFAAMA